MLFADWRFGPDGAPRPEFVLNQPQSRGATVLLAGDNFGCGSSREHAPWALLAYGFRAVISTSFADIFRNNSLKNGLLPIVVDAATHRQLLAAVAADPAAEVEVDLAAQTLRLPDGRTVAAAHRRLQPALPAGWRGRAGLPALPGTGHRRLRGRPSRPGEYAALAAATPGRA